MPLGAEFFDQSLLVPLAVAPMIAVARLLIILASLAVWFWTQRLLARRNFSDVPDAMPSATITDGLHQLTARFNRRLLDNPRRADALLIASSLVIDLLGLYLLASAIFGRTFEGFIGLFMLFALRQICQAFCPLPPPVGMIWRHPGCPSILVTYGTTCDLFFSGHTAIAVYGCLTLAGALGPIGIAIGCLIAAFEIWTVLVLRAHYTMDIFTGVLAALYVHRLAMDLAPHADRWIAHFVAGIL
jgi:hypothetical protein